MQTTRKGKTPANLSRSLLVVAQPNARLLLVAGKAFALNGKTSKYISDSVYSALLKMGWITAPRQIERDLQESRVTPAGYAMVAALEAQKRKYKQLELHFDGIRSERTQKYA